MLIYERFIRGLGLEPRSAPNSANWLEYLVFLFTPHSYMVLEDSKIIIGAIVLSLFYPNAILILIGVVFYKVYEKNEKEYLESYDRNPSSLIYLIKMKKNQTLTEILQKEPKLALVNHKTKSLLYWCKHYKNIEAHKLILQSMKSSRP